MRRIQTCLILLVLIIACGACSHKNTHDSTNNSAGSTHKSTDKASSESHTTVSNDIPLIHNMDELKAYVEEQLQHGTSEFTFSTKDLDMEDIQNINSLLHGYYGDVVKCKSEGNILSSTVNMTLYCKLSDNYYVERNYYKGEEIPQDNQEALELAEICKRIMRKMKTEVSEDATDYEKELWIHDYIVTHTSYGYSEGEDAQTDNSTAHESYGALVSHKAVCNGYAFGMKLLCTLAGVECRIITGQGNGENHAWNLVRLEDEWYHVDVTWDDPSPDQDGRIFYNYLNINDERASLGHIWNTDRYPEATSMDYNYFIQNDLYCEDYDEFKEKCIRILQEEDRNHIQLMVGDYDGGIYSDMNMEFLFDYSDARSYNIQTLGEIPYMTLLINLNH